MLKLQLYLSSFLHLVQTILLQHSHIFVQKEVHRTYLEAQISVHISFKVRGQVFMEIHICGFSSLTSSDGPWQITFSLLKILKSLVRLGLEISFCQFCLSVNPTLRFYTETQYTNVSYRFTTIRYEDLQKQKQNAVLFLFLSYHKVRPYST